MAEFAAAKKGKKTGAPEAPRFGRVRSNLKVRDSRLLVHVSTQAVISFFLDGYFGFAKRRQVISVQSSH